MRDEYEEKTVLNQSLIWTDDNKPFSVCVNPSCGHIHEITRRPGKNGRPGDKASLPHYAKCRTCGSVRHFTETESTILLAHFEGLETKKRGRPAKAKECMCEKTPEWWLGCINTWSKCPHCGTEHPLTWEDTLVLDYYKAGLEPDMERIREFAVTMAIMRRPLKSSP